MRREGEVTEGDRPGLERRVRRHWTGVLVCIVGCVVALVDLWFDGDHVNYGLAVAVIGAGLVEPSALLAAWKR